MPLYGAMPSDWRRWAKLASNDLLPIVTEPSAIPGYDSKKDGKTPSFIDHNRFVGFKGWSSYVRTPEDIERWAKDGRLSIGVQCRTLRFIDLDISEQTLSVKVQDFIGDKLDTNLPLRYRDDTGSSALVYRLLDAPAVLGKGVVWLSDGGSKIEFLGDGQQILVAGYHPKGELKWDALPDTIAEIPAFGIQQIVALFTALNDEFGSDRTKTWNYNKAELVRSSAIKLDAHDAFAEYLHKEGLVLDTASDGKLYIECPFCKELPGTTEVTKTSAVYMPKGYGGIASGGFNCMKGRHESTLDELQEKVGFLRTLFKAESPETKLTKREVEIANSRPRLEEDRAGNIKPHLLNILKAFRWDIGIGYKVFYDNFMDSILLLNHTSGKTTEIVDEDIVTLREALIVKRFDPAVSDAEVRRVVHRVAKDNQMDSAINWIEMQTWDKRDRFTEFVTECLQVPDTAYHRAASEYIWTALAGRVLVPGIQADMIPVFVGEQGQQKTKLIRALVPEEHMFQEISLIGLAFREAEIARQLRGVLAVEWSELKGINTSEAETIKSWVTRKKETWTPKYKEWASTSLRRFIVFGTSNRYQFLTDPTGSRRYLPVTITTKKINLDWMEANKVQLWAQGAAQFRSTGIAWQQAQELAETNNKKYYRWDSWKQPVQRWLADQARKGVLTHSLSTLLSGAVDLPVARQKTADAYRMRDLMRGLGWRESEEGLWFDDTLV